MSSKADQIRALREARAGGRTVKPRVAKTKTAVRTVAAAAPPSAPETADDAGTDRITFSAPKADGLPTLIEEHRRSKGLRSTSEAIRALLKKGAEA